MRELYFRLILGRIFGCHDTRRNQKTLEEDKSVTIACWETAERKDAQQQVIVSCGDPSMFNSWFLIARLKSPIGRTFLNKGHELLRDLASRHAVSQNTVASNRDPCILQELFFLAMPFVYAISFCVLVDVSWKSQKQWLLLSAKQPTLDIIQL